MSRAKCVVGQMGLAIRAIWSTFSHWLSLGCSVKFFLEQWFQDPNVEQEDDGTDGTWKGKDAAFMWGAPMTLYYKKCLYKSAWLKLLQYWSHSAPAILSGPLSNHLFQSFLYFLFGYCDAALKLFSLLLGEPLPCVEHQVLSASSTSSSFPCRLNRG